MNDTIIGGLLVPAGVLAGQLITLVNAHRDRKERRQQFLREKYEELTQSILDSIEQVQSMTKLSANEVLFSEATPAGPLKAHYSAIIYFPELRDATLEYNNSIATLHLFLIRSVDPDIPLHVGAQAEGRPGYAGIHKEMRRKRSVVEKLIEKNASRYTKA